MQKLIEKLKLGYKICLTNISPDCLELSHKVNFVGTVCNRCHQQKMHQYYKKYNNKRKAEQKTIYGQLQLNKTEAAEIEALCALDTEDDSSDEDDSETESDVTLTITKK